MQVKSRQPCAPSRICRPVSMEEPDLTTQAVDRAEKGMDFADALHLGAAVRCEAMLTFDRRFIESAGNAPLAVTEP